MREVPVLLFPNFIIFILLYDDGDDDCLPPTTTPRMERWEVPQSWQASWTGPLPVSEMCQIVPRGPSLLRLPREFGLSQYSARSPLSPPRSPQRDGSNDSTAHGDQARSTPSPGPPLIDGESNGDEVNGAEPAWASGTTDAILDTIRTLSLPHDLQ
ncbi:MAG: hypothetical protein VX670_11440, partial [Candidatus Latescibacterota bacterium]|nr:hypothetical protein [Candidatus Latescibacterota bacterium]